MTILQNKHVRAGLIAGIVLIYISVIGMMESFSDREIIREVITLGDIMLIAPLVIAGYWGARQL